MLERLEVELITPAMIGGVSSRACDRPAIVRPPAVRGMLHFWTRALRGDDHRKVEVALWGSTERGQGVSISIRQRPFRTETRPLLPHKEEERLRVPTPMMLPNRNNPIELRFRLHDPQLREQLQAVVWTWLHLGSVGRRARRGYGSLLWRPKEGDLLSGFVDFDPESILFAPESDLDLQKRLEEYLKEGLKKVVREVGRPTENERSSDDDRFQLATSDDDRFQLATIDQVFVGKVLRAEYDKSPRGMEWFMHGWPWLNRSNRPQEKDQMGHVRGRLASPMMWRIFPCTGGYIPVMTWSPRAGVTRISPRAGMYDDYLNGMLGFSKSLAGNLLRA